MRIIGLVGPKRAGKSTAADALVRERGFVSIGFADALKDLALRTDPYIAEAGLHLRDLHLKVGGEAAKEYPEVRRFYQELGCGVRDIVGKDAWIEAFGRRWLDLGEPEQIVVPDVRFLNEAEELRDSGGLLIRITRPSLAGGDTHISETEQLDIQCDLEIVNDGTIGHLEADILTAVDYCPS